jgi:microcystin-dependent protein
MLLEGYNRSARRQSSSSRGLLLAAGGISLLLASAPRLLAQQPNAWQINDNSTISGVLEFVTNLTSAQVAAAQLNGWHYSLLSSILSDTASPASQSMAFGDGTRRFYIFFDLDSVGNLTAQLLSSSNVTYTLNFPAPDVLKYHLHEMIYDPVTAQATYRCDGNVIASWSGDLSANQSNQVMWGANSSSGRGEMHYHRAEFAIAGQGTLAAYDAGFAGNPATAPSPTNQGWTRLSSGLVPLESALSPDAEFIHPVAVTSNATYLHPGQATLNASVNANGWPAVCWFDHGPTIGYGSSTPQIPLGNATAFVPASSLVTGLPRAVPYHFRVVASNSVGAVYGNDLTVSVPDSPPIPSAPAGGGQPFDIRQPSLELNYIICTNGNYPDSLTMQPPFLGEVRLFAGAFAPAGWAFCQGQFLATNGNFALLSILRTTYGGHGGTNFALPDLRSRAVVEAGSGPGLAPWTLGEIQGAGQVTLQVAELPAHAHTLPPPYTITGPTGGSLPRANRKPSLGLSCLFAVQGQYPFGTQAVYEPFLAQMPFFAGSFAGGDFTLASGQLLPLSQNQPLYAVLGTNYGGDGLTAFQLPDLRGRVPMGNGQGPGLSARSLAQQTGSDTVAMSVAQMPAHQHAVPWSPPLEFLTGTSGSNQPQSLIEPSLVLQYLIATNGEVPSVSTPATNKMIGEIQLFAGATVPGGWTPCNGQLLSVAANPALFGVISNFYGGDGVSTFALPDLSSRIPVGSTNRQPGAAYGAEQAVLTVAAMPPHTHSAPALDFDSWVTAFGLSGANAAFDADADGDGAANGFEWATGTSPTNSASFAGLNIASADDAVNLQFTRNTNATDVSLSLERTVDLTNPNAWASIVTNLAGLWYPPAVVLETGATNPVNVTVSDPRTNLPAADYRLKIQWP